MDNPLLNMEDAQTRLEAWRDRTVDFASQTETASRALQELKATGADDNGVAQVTVDASGALAGIKLSSRVKRQDPQDTEAVIIEAYRVARVNLAKAAAEIIAETVGTDTPTGRALLASFTTGQAPEGT
ncbi:hypothetical protein GCM10009853_029850 [Glycomyces scopariae]|uniref:YbaB/EbfC DNA-binding family protein n=1 Tax=Glycomyces sambucus TaxID=380244 RepID=A0A1G9FYA0_9ACTN|nr:YbaB/EbfC family nucleoid-associated protein [Glycomyces sambucus]SDK93386.1 YbaB/EbfC DNA-binding family protein [Glycomyces sambucus]